MRRALSDLVTVHGVIRIGTDGAAQVGVAGIFFHAVQPSNFLDQIHLAFLDPRERWGNFKRSGRVIRAREGFLVQQRGRVRVGRNHRHVRRAGQVCTIASRDS